MVDFTEVLQPERPEANLLESGSNAETHHIALMVYLKVIMASLVTQHFV